MGEQSSGFHGKPWLADHYGEICDNRGELNECQIINGIHALEAQLQTAKAALHLVEHTSTIYQPSADVDPLLNNWIGMSIVHLQRILYATRAALNQLEEPPTNE